jgi:hypothetical protein
MQNLTPREERDSLRVDNFYVVSGCFAGVIIALSLLLYPIVDGGPGLPGIDSTVSIAVIGSVISVALVGLLHTIRRRTKQGHVGDGAQPPRRKCELGIEEWFAILTEAESEFYVAGHTMGKWCDRSRQERFASHIRRILAEDGTVTFVMLDPESPQLPILQRATGTDYSTRIAESVPVLEELRSTLDPVHRARLKVTQIRGDGAIPYMVVGNERRLLTAAYLARTDSDDMPCIELLRESESATVIYDDFHKLADGR